MMRAPRFWSDPTPDWPARLLAPFGTLYGAVVARRMAGTGRKVAPKVICVGNFTLGGAGKTPAALAIAEKLIAAGERVAFLSRGYRGALSGASPIAVDPMRHRAHEVGDEPLLLARLAPTFICADRVAGALAAAQSGASVVVMDDGLQNPSLFKDERIAVVDGASGLGNGLVFPAGPLRAPMARQWDHVDAVLIVGPGAAGEALAGEAAGRGKRVLRARLAPDPCVVASLSGRRLLAFAGIGRPDKFFATLEAAGLDVAERVAFADHHPYSDADIAELKRRALAGGLVLATTEKDFVRLTAQARPAGLTALPARLEFLSGEKP